MTKAKKGGLSVGQSERNSLIELYRFILSINVLMSHGLFIYNGPYFGSGRESVEFFFILSGYFFASYLKKHGCEHLIKDTIRMLIDKVRPIFVPLAVGIGSNLVYSLICGKYRPWGYLWYVRVMLICFVFYFILNKYLKNTKIFLSVVAIIGLVTMGLKFFTQLYPNGHIRAFSAISLGILLYYIPRIKLKRKWPIICALTVVGAVCLAILMLHLGDIRYHGILWVEIILDMLLYPALIYLTLMVRVRNPIFNYLGALSFGIYAFQCPADLLRQVGCNNTLLLFIIILTLSVGADLIKGVAKLKSKSLPKLGGKEGKT